MSNPQIVDVALGERSYPILIGPGLLGASDTKSLSPRVESAAAVEIRSRLEPTRAIVVFDRAVRSLAEGTSRGLESLDVRVARIEVPSGEASKSVAQLERLWNEFREAGADRDSIVVAIGGGVIGDLAGFAAASYARGLRFVQIPTTLLAQVDSSVGGKTGINLAAGKNLVGAFWQPKLVVIDTDSLVTLPEREYVSGLAEVIKYGMIGDERLLERLEQEVEPILAREAAVLTDVIASCCRAKGAVVERDEFERSGLRASLNYGHTFAHAFENVLGYGTLLHGEAVSIGMACAARLATHLGRISAADAERQDRLSARFGLPVRVPRADHQALIEAMGRDKKVSHGRLRFVLPSGIGRVELVGDVDLELVRQVLVELTDDRS